MKPHVIGMNNKWKPGACVHCQLIRHCGSTFKAVKRCPLKDLKPVKQLPPEVSVGNIYIEVKK